MSAPPCWALYVSQAAITWSACDCAVAAALPEILIPATGPVRITPQPNLWGKDTDRTAAVSEFLGRKAGAGLGEWL